MFSKLQNNTQDEMFWTSFSLDLLLINKLKAVLSETLPSFLDSELVSEATNLYFVPILYQEFCVNFFFLFFGIKQLLLFCQKQKKTRSNLFRKSTHCSTSCQDLCIFSHWPLMIWGPGVWKLPPTPLLGVGQVIPRWPGESRTECVGVSPNRAHSWCRQIYIC